MKVVTLLVAGVVVIATSGCSAYRTAVTSNEKSAYIVKGGLFGSSMYHCKAEPKPTCTQVEESE